MTDQAELRRLAEACDVSRCADEGEERRRLHDFYDCIEPELILSMLNEIAENDSMVAVWRGRTQRTEEERDRLKAENEALRQFAAEAYQVLGALDAPENVLDNASDAASGVPPRHETLLPFFAEGYEALRKDAERWRYARTILPYEVIQDAQKDFESWGGDVSEAENKRCDDAIDAALQGGGR